MKAQAWIRRHKNDDPKDAHLYVDTCKDEANKWLSQFKPGYAWLEPLVSIEELDRLLPVVEAAKGLAHGEDWNNGTHAKIYRPKLIAALRALERAHVEHQGPRSGPLHGPVGPHCSQNGNG